MTTALERNCAIQPRRSSASARNSSAGDERDRRDELGGLRRPPSPATSTAPPATAASDELGPVEIWRDVQKSA